MLHLNELCLNPSMSEGKAIINIKPGLERRIGGMVQQLRVLIDLAVDSGWVNSTSLVTHT